jgi:F0F1-type ATP synthase assembly protein I
VRKIEPTNLGSSLRDMAPYLDLGLRFAASAILFGLAGYWLDGKLHTTPLGLILGVMLGGTGGFIYIYRTVMRLTENEKRKQGDGKPA